MSEREELAKWAESEANLWLYHPAGKEHRPFLLRVAALLRQPAAPVQVSEAMVKTSAKAIAKHDAPGAVWQQMHPTWRSKYKQLAKDALEAALQAGRK